VGLLQSIFGYKDPAQQWPVVGGQKLVFDCDKNTLNGVALHSPWTSLEPFGPPELKRRRAEDSLVYHSRGFSTDLYQGNISSYSFVWDDYLRQGFQPFQGTFTYQGKDLELSDDTTEKQLESIFGEAYWRDEGKDEVILFYELEGVEWQVELDLKGRLKTFLVLAYPVLADEFQRQAYKVTKPWPTWG
jgi:hypothetical protein